MEKVSYKCKIWVYWECWVFLTVTSITVKVQQWLLYLRIIIGNFIKIINYRQLDKQIKRSLSFVSFVNTHHGITFFDKQSLSSSRLCLELFIINKFNKFLYNDLWIFSYFSYIIRFWSFYLYSITVYRSNNSLFPFLLSSFHEFRRFMQSFFLLSLLRRTSPDLLTSTLFEFNCFIMVFIIFII